MKAHEKQIPISQLSGEIGIKSREANLELNVTHEIRVDARIDSLLQAWQAVVK